MVFSTVRFVSPWSRVSSKCCMANGSQGWAPSEIPGGSERQHQQRNGELLHTLTSPFPGSPICLVYGRSSPPRCNEAGKIGFVSDLRRMNVAITRARRGLVVVGHPPTLATNTYWRQWIGFMQKVGSILSPEDFP